MSDIALNSNNTGYRSPTWRRPESLGRPAGRRNFRETEHPIPDPDRPVDPIAVEFNSVRFRDSGFWPYDGPLPQWYRRVRTSTTNMSPPTVSGIDGEYIYKNDARIAPGDILLVGSNDYRLYLYLGYCCWYPLHQDLPIPGRNQLARNRMVAALRSLHIYAPEVLVAGCAARAARDLLTANMEQNWEHGYAAVVEGLVGCRWWGALQRLVAGVPPMQSWEQIAVSGPFQLALIEGLTSPEGATRLLDAVRTSTAEIENLPTIDDLLRDRQEDDGNDLGEDFFASQEVETTAEPAARSFRRVMLYNAETEPEL